MTLSRTWAIAWAIVAGFVVFLAGVVTISDQWDEVEQLLGWMFPLPLLILLLVSNAVFVGLYLHERRRKSPKTYGEVSAEEKEARRERKEETRLATTQVLNELASNRRLAEAALGKGGMSRTPATEAWIQHRGTLGRLRQVEGAYAAAVEAYDAFADLDSADIGAGYSHIEDGEFNAAIEKAQRAEEQLKSVQFAIEGPLRARWAVLDPLRDD